MTTRLMLGYGLVGLLVGLGLIALWFSVIRERMAHRRRRARGERERVVRQRDNDRQRDKDRQRDDARPAFEAD